MKKYLIFALCAVVISFVACQKESVKVEEPVQAETHLTLNFNITRGDEPATKAVKTSWEEGDIIYFFFDKVMDGHWLRLTYKSGNWVPYWFDSTLEARIAANSSGTITALYMFARKETQWGPSYSDYISFDPLDGSGNWLYSWYLQCLDASYTVTAGSLSADISLVMPPEYDFVQFSIPGLEGYDGRWKINTYPSIRPVHIRKYHKDDGFVTNEGGNMVGYYYTDGTTFCGVLPAAQKDVASNYTFTLTNSENNAQYRYAVSAKTLTRGKAIKLPALNKWTVLDSGDATPAYVDLGLPSGIKWATFNLGATIPEEMGSTYPWGHTSPESTVSWSLYQFYESGSNDNDVVFNKYIANPPSVVNLDIADDAANAHPAWGDKYRMPTDDEWYELKSNCTVESITYNGVSGNKVTGPNGKYIFIPEGLYWSSTLSEMPANSTVAVAYMNGTGYINPDIGSTRRTALYIRPVYDPDFVFGINAVPMCEINGDVLYVADRNLGASSPEDAGRYYAWGETIGYTSSEGHYFNDANYVFNVGGELDKFSKYVKSGQAEYWGVAGDPDDLIELEAMNDAAAVELGGDWHIPTTLEMNFLRNNCDWVWDAVRCGYTVTGQGTYSANSIFIPAAGHCNSLISEYGIQGYYWTNRISYDQSYNALVLRFDSAGQYTSDEGRGHGVSIRAVRY